jgi:hypothetical protein
MYTLDKTTFQHICPIEEYEACGMNQFLCRAPPPCAVTVEGFLVGFQSTKKAGRLDPAFNLKNLVAGVGFEPTTFGL